MKNENDGLTDYFARIIGHGAAILNQVPTPMHVEMIYHLKQRSYVGHSSGGLEDDFIATAPIFRSSDNVVHSQSKSPQLSSKQTSSGLDSRNVCQLQRGTTYRVAELFAQVQAMEDGRCKQHIIKRMRKYNHQQEPLDTQAAMRNTVFGDVRKSIRVSWMIFINVYALYMGKGMYD